MSDDISNNILVKEDSSDSLKDIFVTSWDYDNIDTTTNPKKEINVPAVMDNNNDNNKTKQQQHHDDEDIYSEMSSAALTIPASNRKNNNNNIKMKQELDNNNGSNNSDSNNKVFLPKFHTSKVVKFASNTEILNDDDTLLKNGNDVDIVFNGTTNAAAASTSTGYSQVAIEEPVEKDIISKDSSITESTRMKLLMMQNNDPSRYDIAISNLSEPSSDIHDDVSTPMFHRDPVVKSESTTPNITNGIDDADTNTNRSRGILPRLVDRNLPFYQSKNCIQIDNCFNTMKDSNYNHKSSNKNNNDDDNDIQNTNDNVLLRTRYDLWKLLQSDWFHISLRIQWFLSIPILLMMWTIMIIVWAGIYVWIDNRAPNVSCGLGPAGDPINYYGAFAFSLETCTTVGYGLPSNVNSFFENCPELQVAIYFQMVWSMLFNAFLVSFFYAKSAQCDSRSVQVIFSNQAIISIVNISEDNQDNNKNNNNNINDLNYRAHQQVRFQIRVYDIDRRSNIIESHVRVYAVMKNRPVPRQLRLIQPDDEFNAMVLLSFPTTISHHIDLYSMLHPPPPPRLPSPLQSTSPSNQMENENDQSSSSLDLDISSSSQHKYQHLLPYLTSSNGLSALRQVDSLTGNRDEIICPICGESYGDVDRWMLHVERFQLEEKIGEYPIPNTHRALLAPSSNTLSTTCTKASKKKPTITATTTESSQSNDNDNFNELNNDNVYEYARTYLQPTLDIESIRQYFYNNISEIIVVVEGIEPTNSGTFAALQSYQYNDIVFHPTATFQSCVNVEKLQTKKNNKDQNESRMMVDLDCFHNIDYKET